MKNLSLAKGLTQLRQQDPWELTWECTWQRRTRRDWELAKATKPVKMAGIPQGTGRSQKKVQNCLLLTLNLTTCLFLVCFPKKNYTAFTCVLPFLMWRTFASQRRTTWIVILVFFWNFFWSKLNYIAVLCPCYLTLNLWNQSQNEKQFGKNIIMLILKQEITFNLRFPNTLWRFWCLLKLSLETSLELVWTVKRGHSKTLSRS